MQQFGSKAMSYGPSITTPPALAPCEAGFPYALAFAGTGGTPAYSYNVIAGAIPPGCTLAASGNLSGTPSASGNYSFTLQITDASGATSNPVAYLLIVGVQTTITSTSPLPVGTVGVAYSTMLTMTGAFSPNTWSLVAGSLDPGLSYNSSSGVISGTPTTATTYSPTFRVTDVLGHFAQMAFSLTINAAALTNYLGANGQPINYFTPEFPFLDILKEGGNNNGYWGTVVGAGSQTPTNEEAYLQLDANGYPTTLTALPGHTQTYDRVFTYVNRSTVTSAPTQTSYYPAGAYTFSTQGAGIIAFTGDVSSLANASAGISIAGLQVTSSLAAGVTGTFTVNITTPSEGGFEWYISQTDPSSVGNYIKACSCVQTSLLAQYAGGNVFHPTFKAALTGFSCFRWMKGLNTESDDLNLFFSAQLNAGNNTGGTLTNITFPGGNYGATWPFKTGTRNVAFQTGQVIACGFTTGSSAVTWSTALSANVVTNQLSGAGVMAIVPKTQGWAGRTPFTALGWSPVPFEVCLQLGNEMPLDTWVNIPCVGYYTDTTMGTKLAQLAFNGTGTTMPGFTGLKSTQKTYIEFSNEVWNFQYNSCRFSYSMGAVYIPSQGNTSFAAQQWYGTQVGNIAAQFSAVYGSAFAAQVIVSMGTQLAQLSTLLPQAMNAADWVAQGGGHVAPSTQGVGAYHSNPYCPGVFQIKNTDLVAINALADPKSALLGLLYGDTYGGVTYPSLQSAGLIGALSAYIAGQLAGIAGQSWHTLPHLGYESGDGLCFNNPLNTGDSIVGVAITGTAGQFSCTAGKNLTVGMQLTIAGTFGGTGSITGYANPTTYQVSATNGSTTFTLQTLAGGAIVTTAGTPTGLTYTCNLSAAQTTAITAWLLSLVRDPRMAQFYYDPTSTLGGTGYLPAMYQYYKSINHFQLINPNSQGNSTWGALENVGQTISPLSSAPAKYQGLQDFIAA